ncbi:MAG TPA: 50S ribosomal protein L6 [archaeon]|nr:50S ribosomal protein L6 [archaeon]
MEKSITILNDVDVTVDGLSLKVKGPMGEISKSFDDPRYCDIKIAKDGNNISISYLGEDRKSFAMIGTIHAHLRNMMHGVTTGYVYEMKVIFKHFPMTVSVKAGNIEVKNFLGEKSIREVPVIGKAEVKIDKENITVSGIDIEEVAQTAANIERACKLRGRDRRIFQDGIYITTRHTSKGVVHG